MNRFEDFKKLDEIERKRQDKIVKTSIFGIIGLSANSIAILVDAVNNLADAGSSVITIIGTKLAAKEPDKDHPLWIW